MQKKNDLITYPVNDYRNYLEHSAKGTTWKNHKYVAIKNGRYIYPQESAKGAIAKRVTDRIINDYEKMQKQLDDLDREFQDKVNQQNRAREWGDRAISSNAPEGNRVDMQYRDYLSAEQKKLVEIKRKQKDIKEKMSAYEKNIEI